MRWSVKILRWLAPICERERMEFRHALAMAQAHAEDLTRMTVGLDAALLRRAIQQPQEAK
jgi:hypothetical protein